MKFTDSHCHLDFPEFSSGYRELLSQCHLDNIHQIIVPAISPDNWNNVIACCQPSLHQEPHNNNQQAAPKCYPALGIHPWFLNNLRESTLDELEKKVTEHRSVLIAIGETGIDMPIAKEQNNLAKQVLFFDVQIELAHKQKLPLIVHHRSSHDIIIKRLKEKKFQIGGILHAFSGSYQQAKQYIDLGFKLGIGGTITYPRAQKTIKAIRKLPLHTMVLETDAPSMPLHGFQGTANSPLRLLNIFSALCEIRDESKEDLAHSLENNIQHFLNTSQ